MRTPTRIATTAVAVAAVFPIGIGPAHAETATETAALGAYYSRLTPAKTDEMPADPAPYFNRLNSDRVAPGNLAVAVVAPNQSDKESFVGFELSSVSLLTIDHTVTITKATVTAPLAPDDADNRSVSPAPDKVKACAAGTEGFYDADAGAYDEKPSVDCGVFTAPAKATADGKAYQFDVTQAAQSWLTGSNEGIALVPAKVDQPFQVVFQGRDKITIAYEYTATPIDTGVGPVVPIPTTVPLPPVSGGSVYTPPNTSVPPTVNTPVTRPTPTVAPRPAVAPRQQQPQQFAAAAGYSEVGTPSFLFWLAAIAGVFLIGAISLFLGSPEVPVAASSRQNGVGRALDERRRVAGRPGVRPRSVRPA